MKKIKTGLTATIFALVMMVSTAPVVMADNHKEQVCRTDRMEPSSNVVVDIVSIPFKMIAAFAFLPLCLIELFPTNEE